jgi:hypothetical protein
MGETSGTIFPSTFSRQQTRHPIVESALLPNITEVVIAVHAHVGIGQFDAC